MNTHLQMLVATFHCSYVEPPWALWMQLFLMASVVIGSPPEAISTIATTLRRFQSAHRWLLHVKQVEVIIPCWVTGKRSMAPFASLLHLGLQSVEHGMLGMVTAQVFDNHQVYPEYIIWYQRQF